MKSRKMIFQHAVLAAALAVMQTGCQLQSMSSSDEVPASEGTIRVTEGDNGNTKLSVRVKHLAAPSKVVPSATVYVVWIQPPYAERQNVGVLNVNEDLVGRLDTVTPYHRFKVTVTPETSGQTEHPMHDPVLTFDAALPK